jgi:hypothetical protein
MKSYHVQTKAFNIIFVLDDSQRLGQKLEKYKLYNLYKHNLNLRTGKRLMENFIPDRPEV